MKCVKVKMENKLKSYTVLNAMLTSRQIWITVKIVTFAFMDLTTIVCSSVNALAVGTSTALEGQLACS